MICPHCKKPIDKKITPQIKKKVLELHKLGYSSRDIEACLDRAVSFSTAARIIKQAKDSK